MNIKSILPQVSSLETKVKAEPKQVTLEESQDRDSNSRHGGESKYPQREMTEEELNKALEVIEALPGVQSSALTVKLVKSEGHSVVLIVGPKGEIVRRLTTADLWHVLNHQEKKTGQIFDKVM